MALAVWGSSTGGPEDAETAYAVWLGVARRNVAETARRLNLNANTVQSWAHRYRWKERAATEDREYTADMVGWAWRELAGMIPYALAIKRSSMMMPVDVDTGDTANTCGEGPAPLPFDKDRDKSADRLLATFGMAPQRHIVLSPGPAVSTSVSDAALDALAASDDSADLDILLALASGRSVDLPVPGEDPLPGDFTSAQPGGRVVPEPSFAVPHDFESPSAPVPHPTKPRARKQPDPFEANWRAVDRGNDQS